MELVNYKAFCYWRRESEDGTCLPWFRLHVMWVNDLPRFMHESCCMLPSYGRHYVLAVISGYSTLHRVWLLISQNALVAVAIKFLTRTHIFYFLKS